MIGYKRAIKSASSIMGKCSMLVLQSVLYRAMWAGMFWGKTPAVFSRTLRHWKTGQWPRTMSNNVGIRGQQGDPAGPTRISQEHRGKGTCS